MKANPAELNRAAKYGTHRTNSYEILEANNHHVMNLFQPFARVSLTLFFFAKKGNSFNVTPNFVCGCETGCEINGANVLSDAGGPVTQYWILGGCLCRMRGNQNDRSANEINSRIDGAGGFRLIRSVRVSYVRLEYASRQSEHKIECLPAYGRRMHRNVCSHILICLTINKPSARL